MARAASARLVPLMVAATLVAAAVVWTWPRLGVTVDLFYPKPARGVSGAEFVGVVLASALPAFQLNPFGLQERRSGARVGILLTTVALLGVLLPTVPFVVWFGRVHLLDLGVTPEPAPFVGSLLLYAAAGLLLTQLLGPLAGPLASLGSFAVLVVAQNYWGPAAVGRLFSTGNVWQTNWFAVTVLLGGALAFTYRTRGATVRPVRAVER